MCDISSNTQLQIFFYVMYQKVRSKGLVFDIEHNRKSWKYLFIVISRDDSVANLHRLDFCVYLGLIYNMCNLYANWDIL